MPILPSRLVELLVDVPLTTSMDQGSLLDRNVFFFFLFFFFMSSFPVKRFILYYAYIYRMIIYTIFLLSSYNLKKKKSLKN